MKDPTVVELALALATAAAAGLVGCFAVMRRMTLASDALSHVALPGIGIALALGVSPLLGGLAALLVGTLFIWMLEYKTRVPTEALIGVVFSAALAAGSMLASGEDLMDALLGAPVTLGRGEMIAGLAGAGLIIGFVLTARHHLVISLVSPDLARTTGIDVPRMNLLYLLAFALTVALGLRHLGVLLMGSLVIIPAATAKHLAKGLPGMLLIAGGNAVLASLAGMLASPILGIEPGPLTIVAAAGLFFASLLRRRPG